MMLDPHRGMLDCPMCKRLSNVLVPISMWASTNSSVGLQPAISVSAMAVSSSEGIDMSGIAVDALDDPMTTSIGDVDAVDLGKRKRTSSASLDAAVDHQLTSCNSLQPPTTSPNNDREMWTRWIQRPILYQQVADILVPSAAAATANGDVVMVESSEKFEDAHEGMDGMQDDDDNDDDDDDDDEDSDDERPAMVDFADAVDDLYDNEEDDEEDEDENEHVTWYETGDNDDDDSLSGFFEVLVECDSYFINLLLTPILTSPPPPLR